MIYQMKKIGLLGGTFNPPHRGHLALGEDACSHCELDELWLVVAKTPPHKPHMNDPGWEHRKQMCELLIGQRKHWKICEIEEELPSPSYTVHTIKALKERYPDNDWVWIMGSDSAQDFNQWFGYQYLVENVDFAVSGRNDCEGERAAKIMRELGANCTSLPMKPIKVASSRVREEVKSGDLSRLIPEEIWAYIAKYGLYR
jgi:nicotinate-nucleotide adenylyltransferase